MNVMSPLRRFGWGLCLCAFAVSISTADEPPDRRPVVAVLGFEDALGEPDASHWAGSFNRLVKDQLAAVRSIRVVRDGEETALRLLGLKSGVALTAEDARHAGELLEAQRVVLGSCRREGGAWAVTARLVHVASGRASDEVRAASDDWFELRDRVSALVLREMLIELSASERERFAKRWTTSRECLEALSRAAASRDAGEPASAWEAHVRRALQSDPLCARAHSTLAAVLGTQGKLAEALLSARTAIDLDPILSHPHMALGVTALFQGRSEEARAEQERAHELDPDDPEPISRLGEIHVNSRRSREAATSFEEAVRLSPLNAVFLAGLAESLAGTGEQENATRAVERAVQLCRDGRGAHQKLSFAYSKLGQWGLALEYYERFAAEARTLGLNPTALKSMAAYAESLKAKLRPEAVEAQVPEAMPTEAFADGVGKHLPPSEAALVRNPLALGAALKSRAESLTAGLVTDTDKAHAIFEAVRGRYRPGPMSNRTAAEALAALSKNDERFVCQDHAILYVALARAAGLRAAYTDVEKDNADRWVAHACAAVNLDGQTYLIDPTLSWFGVPHKRFQVLDDIQTAAIYLSSDPGAQSRALAVSLFRESVYLQARAAIAAARGGNDALAKQHIALAEAIEPGRWEILYARGFLATQEKRWAEAERLVSKALELYPSSDPLHLLMAQVLEGRREYERALTQYRTARSFASTQEIVDAAMESASRIADQLSTQPIDILLQNGDVYDGQNELSRKVDVGIRGDRIVLVGDAKGKTARVTINAQGLVVCPGFINVLSWSNESLILDGRGLGELKQGVTTQIFGEGESMGPLNDAMKSEGKSQQSLVHFEYEWNTLGEYLAWLEKRGIAQNVASFVGATTIREHVLGHADRAPNADELERMRGLVRQAMEEGALGVGSSLVYAPAFYAKTDELVELCKVAAAHGGMYISHLRSEGDRLLEGVDELLEISRRAGIPAEIYHLKAAGRANWPKLDEAIAKIVKARADGLRITANMYTYPAASTGLDACVPPWAHEGGNEAMWARIKDPATRARIASEIQGVGGTWENFYRAAGSPDGILIVDCARSENKRLQGKTLAEIAKERGRDPVETLLDLLVDDRSRVTCVYFLMSEENVLKEVKLPWVSLGSDAQAMAAEDPFLKVSTHPRAYGCFARLLGKYVRDEGAITLGQAILRLSALPATTLKLQDRGTITEGAFADVIVFDPKTIGDRATYGNPHQYAVGMRHVFVNGVQVLKDGEPTGSKAGRALFGPGKK